MSDRLIAGGARVQVLINGEPVGLATNAAYDEDWAVTPANVLGYLGPIDYDSQGYACTITLGTFVPESPNTGPWPDGGIKCFNDLLITRSEVQAQAGKPQEFELLQFMNIHTGEVINQFRKCCLANNGTQISPNSYITANVRLMSVERQI